MSQKLLINSSYKLKKIHPIILQNDKNLLTQYIKEKIINSRNKKFYFHNSTNPKHINIKALIPPNCENKNKFMKTEHLGYQQKKNRVKSTLYSLNNNSNLNLRNNFYKEKYNLDNFIFNQKITTPNKYIIDNIKKEKNKINEYTNISNGLYRYENNNNDKKEDKIVSTDKSELTNSNIFKSKPFILDNKKYNFKKYNSSKNKDLKVINKTIINKMNFITNIKSTNEKINNDEKENKSYFYLKTFNTENFKKMNFKKDKMLESLKNSSIWNDYTNLEKSKKLQQLKNKRRMKEDILNIIKLFRDSYSFKKYRNKNKLNKKEKYLNFLEDQSLELRENLIKNYIQDDRGGKQNLRQIYNPRITYK